MRAFDMSRHQRVIATTDGRISGTWVVLDGGRALWIKPHDVTIYDETHSFGTILGRDDFQASFENGVIDIGIVRDRVKHDVEDVREMLTELLEAIAQAFQGEPGNVVELSSSTSEES